jgi:competence protein ComFC
LCVESFEQNELFQSLQKKDLLYLPVPLSRQKYKKRGYNHASLLCSYVAQYFNKDYKSDLILRVKDTQPQYKLSKTQRSLNVKNAFKINDKHKEKIKGQVIVIVDDVATTCSTLREISKILKRNGAKEVWGVVFARDDKADFR